MRDNVARVRRLLEEAATSKQRRDQLVPASESQQSQALRAFHGYLANAGDEIVAQQTPRARAAREITRIATWYGWTGEVKRALDAAEAPTLHCMAIEALEELRDRMRLLEECVQTGGDAPDAPPAR